MDGSLWGAVAAFLLVILVGGVLVLAGLIYLAIQAYRLDSEWEKDFLAGSAQVQDEDKEGK